MPRRVKLPVLAAPFVLLCVASLGGCASLSPFRSSLDERECLTRVMYFESNRSSDEGMFAVGTVVMNRVESGRYPRTICGVVGQPGQFAPGVLSLPMRADERARSLRIANAILAGARHSGVGHAMFFHTAGLTFPYTNMHYVLVAGGNAFYEKIPSAERRYAARRRPHSIGDMIARMFSGITRL